MNVVGHYSEAMQMIMLRIAKAERFDYQAGDLWLAQITGARGGLIEEPIQVQKSLSGSGCFGETAVLRKAAIKPPRQECGLTDGVEMGQPPGVERRHK